MAQVWPGLYTGRMRDVGETGAEPGDLNCVTTHHVRRAVAGDEGSLGWLVERFGPLLAAQARYRLGPDLSARIGVEDLIADAWLAVLPKLEKLEARGGRYTPVLLSFLSSTLRFEANNRLRSVFRRETRQLTSQGGTGAEHPLRARGSGLREAVAQVSLTETARILAEGIRGLSEADREVILLRGVEGLGYEAIAAETGREAASLRQRYRRALDRLRQGLPASVFTELVDD